MGISSELIFSYSEDFSLILQLKIRDIVIHVDMQYVVYVIEDMVYFDWIKVLCCSNIHQCFLY